MSRLQTKRPHRSAPPHREPRSREDVLAKLYPIAALRELPGRTLVGEGGYDIGALMNLLDLGPEELGDALGVSAKTVQRWRKSEHIPDRAAQEKMAQLAYAVLLLTDLVGLAEARRWFWAPNPLFAGAPPRALVQEGKMDRIVELLTRLDEGIPD